MNNANQNDKKYTTDECWPEVQQFLPLRNRLSDNNMPDEYFIDINGAKIHVDHYRANTRKTTIVLFHGVGGNGRLLSFIAVPLFLQGYEVICPDLPLYRYSEYKGTIGYSEWVDCGIEIVKQYFQSGNSIFLFGLSAGGTLRIK